MEIPNEGKTTSAGPRHGANNPPERTVVEEHENPPTAAMGREKENAGRVNVDAPRNPLEPSGSGAKGDSGAKEEMKEKVHNLSEKAREAGKKATAEGKSKAYGLLGDGKQRAASSLGNTAQALYRIGDQFRKNDQDGIGQYAERASSQIQGFSDYLYDRDPDDIVRDVQEAARRRPWIAIGGAFIAGLATARFLKASRRQ